MERRRLKPRRGPVIKKARFNNFTRLESEDSLAQEPYITGANLERAEGYLRYLEQERDKRHWEYMKSGKKLHEVLFKNTLLQWNTARIMFQILTGSEEVSRRLAEGACEE